MKQGYKELTFSVKGEFITQLAREWMFCEEREFEKVMDLLLSCMGGTEMSEKELRRRAEDVLIGRAEFSGNTANGTFCMTAYNANEQPDIPERFNIFCRYSEEIRKRKEAEKEKEMYMEWYKLAEQIIVASGNEQLLERVKDYCKNHCAWLHREQDVEKYAIECIMSEAYMAWEDFEADPIETAKWFFCF